MAITKKQGQKIQKIFENVISLLSDIENLGSTGEVRHAEIRGELFIVSGKELDVLDAKIYDIYNELQKFCIEMELDNGKA